MARNSPAAERLGPWAEFPRASALSALLSLAWSILCFGEEGKGPEGRGCWEEMLLCLSKVAVRLCVCVCARVELRGDEMDASDSVVCRGRGGTMSAPARSSLSWKVTLLSSSWARCQGHGACYCLAKRTLGGRQSLGSPCPLSFRLGLLFSSDVVSLLKPSIRNQSGRRKRSVLLVLGVLLFEGSEICFP